MEIASLKSILLPILLVTIVTWAWWIVNWVWWRPKKLERYLRQQGLTGSPYRVLFGDLKENSMMLKQAKSSPMNLGDEITPRLAPFLQQTVKKYGKNSFIWIGTTPRVNIMNPNQIKEIFMRNNDFQKNVANPLGRLLATGLASHEGDKWVKHRRIITPTFHLEKLKHMFPAFYQCCDEMISKWEKLVSVEGSVELDVWPYLSDLTSDAISRTAFGSNYDEGRRIFELIRELACLTIQVINSVYIPGWRFLPTKMNKRMKEFDKEIDALLMGIITKREVAMKAGGAPKDDLLGLLMESNFRVIEEHGNNKNAGISIPDVVGECKVFYFAGQETTSVLLVWTMVLLSKHQVWQSRAREEVFQVFGNEKPDFDGLNHLKIVQMIFYEVLRLYPPVNVIARSVNKETKLGNLSLPSGVQVSIPAILVHYDHDLWGDDASEFKPERFLEGISKVTKNQVSFFPFGWGPRICIGQNFALIEAKLALATVLQKFTFELSPSYVHSPISVFTLQPQYGAHLILRKS